MPRKATGQLILRKNGYYGRYLATVDGVRKHVSKDLGTKNEVIAARRLATLVAAEEAGTTATLVETFEQAAVRVHQERARSLPGAVSEISFLRRHAFPIIGHMPVTEIGKADTMTVMEAVRDKGRAAQTILHVRNAMAAVFKHLKREGIVQALPLPSSDELPESLPESIDDRPKAVLSDDELLIYLAYTDPRTTEVHRGPVRERQMMALLSRCVGGLRTGELHGLTWARARADGGTFDALEVVRYKTRRKAARQGSKAVSRQLYPLGDTVLPMFLRYWHARTTKIAGVAPAADDLLFPVRHLRSRVGQRRLRITWAAALRRDVERAFRQALDNGAHDVPEPGSRRWLELFEGTDDRRPLWFHNSRNAAAVMAERFERLKAAAKFTGHASARMLQHYREMAGEVDVVPVVPELLPEADALLAVLREWCKADDLDPSLVFGEDPENGAVENAAGNRRHGESPQIDAISHKASEPEVAEIIASSGRHSSIAAENFVPAGRTAKFALMRTYWLLSALVMAFVSTSPVRAFELPCRHEDVLAETAATFLLGGRRVEASLLLPEARAHGFDGVLVHAHEGRDDAALVAWFKSLSERADGPLVCGEASSETRRLVLVSVRGGALQLQGRRIVGRLEPGFSRPHLVVESRSGEVKRIEVNEPELEAGVQLPQELKVSRVQLVAEGPSGPRPVAELAQGRHPTWRAAPPPPTSDEPVARGPRARPVEALFARIDGFRRSEGASALRPNQLLSNSAQRHAERVCELGRVAHRLRQGEDPETRLREDHVEARAVGEAVARAESADAALQAVLESPSHRMAVAERRFTDAGIGQAADQKGHTCLVVLLASWPRRIP